jgi:hypothetical protein
MFELSSSNLGKVDNYHIRVGLVDRQLRNCDAGFSFIREEVVVLVSNTAILHFLRLVFYHSMMV